ncbi:unnamed protein product, partial [Choristocarpus tenellus]
KTEGRDGIETSGGAEMLLPIASGRHAQGSPSLLRALCCIVGLARRGEHSTQHPSAGGVGTSGPPCPNPMDLEGKLYADLIDAFEAPPPAPLRTVHALVRMGTLSAVMNFLTPPGDENKGHFFTLTQKHACLGTLILQGLVVLSGAAPEVFSDQVVLFLCYAVQSGYTGITRGSVGPGVNETLLFRSIQVSCRALAFLAANGSDRGCLDAKHKKQEEEIETKGKKESLWRVADCLLTTGVIKQVASLSQMPSRTSGSMYLHLVKCVSCAAILVANVCPVPSGERDPFTRFNFPEDDHRSLQQCTPLMMRLLEDVAGPLCSTLCMADNLEVISHACHALAKLSSTNTTAQTLLDNHNVIKSMIRLSPKAPAVLHGGQEGKGKHQAKEKVQGSPIDKLEKHTRKLTSMTKADETNLRVGRQFRQGEATTTKEKQFSEVEQGKEGVDNKEGQWQGQGINWLGYEMNTEIKDLPTRKLCSLPFNYFRLLANVARVSSGRVSIQNCGLLKRCLERFAISLPEEGAVATLRCRSEICLLLSRVACTYDRDTGTTNEFILCPRYRTISVLLGMVTFQTGASLIKKLARYNAAFALAELSQDRLKVVPAVVQAGGVAMLCNVMKDKLSPLPLLKQVIRAVNSVANFPGETYKPLLSDPTLTRALHRIANSSYPECSRELDCSGSADGDRERMGLALESARSRRSEVHLSLAKSADALKLNEQSSEFRELSDISRETAYSISRLQEQSASWHSAHTSSSSGRSSRENNDVCHFKTTSREGLFREETQGTAVCSNDLVSCRKRINFLTFASQEEAPIQESCPSEGLGGKGTYLACGITTCDSLGSTGAHGGSGAAIPLPSFLLRSVGGRVKEVGGGEGNEEANVKEGVKMHEMHEDAVAVTPLALLSAREVAFRRELMRRKAHHELGRTGVVNEGRLGMDLEREPEKRKESDVCPFKSEARHKASGSPNEGPAGGKTVHINSAHDHLLASTRPFRTTSMPSSEKECVHEPACSPQHAPCCWQPENGYSGTTESAPREFVVFARPATHGSLGVGWGKLNGRNRFMHRSIVVGRFACRGYMLDPTFSDQNPVSNQPRLPKLGRNRDTIDFTAGKGCVRGGLNQQTGEDHDVTLKDLLSTVSETDSGRCRGKEPYHSAVEVLCHRVSVSGARKAAKDRYFDESGQPIFP